MLLEEVLHRRPVRAGGGDVCIVAAPACLSGEVDLRGHSTGGNKACGIQL